MKCLGVCSITFRELSAEDIIKLTKDCGLDCIEWGGDVHVPVGEYSVAEKVKTLTQKAELKINSYGSYFKAGVDGNFEEVSKTAKILGAKVIRIWAGDKDSEEYSEQEYSELVSAVKSCAEIAKNNGQIIAFEYHYVTYCNKSQAILKLMSDVGCENVMTYWQPAYWLKDFSEEQRIAYNLKEIEILKDKIANVHVYAWRGHDRKELKSDSLEWKEYFSNLPQVNGYIEFVKDDSQAQFRLDASHLISIAR